jgi:membrane protease YdiL (CAAX protease family)
MKISENTTETLSHPGEMTAHDIFLFDRVPDSWPVQPHAIAPWWHTAIMVAFILTVSVLTSLESRARGLSGNHVQRYLLGMGWEWVLAAFAWWGMRMRHVTVRQVLGKRRGGWRMWARDFGVAMTFWLISLIVLAALASVLRLMHQMPLQRAVLDLAPQGALELISWFMLCITAGIVEEFVFRGYLLQQFASLGSSGKGTLWLGVLASSLLFGAAHGYEGIGGMIAITAYGAMFSVLAIKRQSLRPGMMAHAWHDSLTGIALAIAKHLRAI